MNEKLKTLQGIFTGCGLDEISVTDYDFTQPDDMDESGSNGVWDLAGDIADNGILRLIYENDNVDDHDYQRTKDALQSLLYNLLCCYKNETGD